MSRDMDLLRPSFREPFVKTLRDVQLKDGFTMRVFFTQRTPWVQAKLWRQSRSSKEVAEAARMLDREGASFLSEVLISVGPQHGKWATNALPGQSWHQWGSAGDCFVLADGRAVWSRRHAGYKAYATRARDNGLTAGYFWQRSPDAVHVQEFSGSVRSQWTWADIDALMRWFQLEQKET